MTVWWRDVERREENAEVWRKNVRREKTERRGEGSIPPGNDWFTVRLRWRSTKWHQRSKRACVCTSADSLSYHLVCLSFRKRKRQGLSCCMQDTSKCLMYVWGVMTRGQQLVEAVYNNFEFNCWKLVKTFLKNWTRRDGFSTHRQVLLK